MKKSAAESDTYRDRKQVGDLKILIAVLFSVQSFFSMNWTFFVCKLNGIRVTEFSLGMGLRLFSFQKGETRYSLKLLPIIAASVRDGW